MSAMPLVATAPVVPEERFSRLPVVRPVLVEVTEIPLPVVRPFKAMSIPVPVVSEAANILMPVKAVAEEAFKSSMDEPATGMPLSVSWSKLEPLARFELEPMEKKLSPKVV